MLLCATLPMNARVPLLKRDRLHAEMADGLGVLLVPEDHVEEVEGE
jgi:hypothetical protein